MLGIEERMTEEQFKNYIKTESELKWDEELCNKIQEEFDNTEYITLGKFGNFDKAHFYLNKENLNVFVVDEAQNSILSCYKVDFDMSEKSTKIMVDNLLEDIEIYKEEKEDSLLDLKAEKGTVVSKIDFIDRELQELKDKITMLQREKKVTSDYLELIDDKIGTLDYKITNTQSKIVNSFGYKKEILNIL
jgi:hypothetical protein